MKPSSIASFAGLVLFFTLVCAGTVLAGPSLPITKPPVIDATILTGPIADPAATNGQWFINHGGAETVRSHEFYDEITGGGTGPGAIEGYVTNIVYDASSNILAFTILATIVNDSQPDAIWQNGGNSHGEQLQGVQYMGPLYDVKLAAEFAVTDLSNLPLSWNLPYRDRQPYIVADNEDQAAWYCWNPAYTNEQRNPAGNYFVPTWDFGDIPQTLFATRQMDFSIPAPGLTNSDARYAVIEQSFANQTDVLANRSTSLKISTWLDECTFDPNFGGEPLRGSDVSVFHNIEESQEETLDFGDAPDPKYPTYLTSGGARHIIVPTVTLGATIDAEADGQPDLTATGDDNTGVPDDEDGVSFPGPLFIGQSVTVGVTCSVSGFLWAWMDFNTNGSWAETSELVFSNQAVVAGMNNLSFVVPAFAAAGKTIARFRFTTQQGTLSYTGLVTDGEVEDYQVTLQDEAEEGLDFGDAMDNSVIPGYPTLLINNGARHTILPGIMMGVAIDTEFDGQPMPSANGDDNNPPLGLDDEDGVLLPPVFVAGSTAQVAVVASVPGFLNAWIDWSNNMNWADSGEQVFSNQALSAGLNNLAVLVPPAVVAGGPHSRWRFTTYAPAMPSYTGAESDGEVEDHEARLENFDFGDAPAPYPTLLSGDGARHRMPSAYWLGSLLDADPEGRPSANADGDDLDNLADEDGVAFGTQLVPGQLAPESVTASTNGLLNAWVDFNRDGDWADGGEQVATNMALNQGLNVVNIPVPSGATLGPTFARFRFSSAGGLSYTGMATDGEVEDYPVTIYQLGPSADIVITNLVRTGAVARIRWRAESGVTYETQAATNQLKNTNILWGAIGGTVVGPVNEQAETNPVGVLRTYRVVAPYAPPPGP